MSNRETLPVITGKMTGRLIGQAREMSRAHNGYVRMLRTYVTDEQKVQEFVSAAQQSSVTTPGLMGLMVGRTQDPAKRAAAIDTEAQFAHACQQLRDLIACCPEGFADEDDFYIAEPNNPEAFATPAPNPALGF